MNALQPGDTIGILGGGQLGRMMAMAGAGMGLKIHVFAPEADPPAAEVSAHHTRAHYGDHDALASFADACDVVTFEFENIPRESLEALAGRVLLRPGILSLETSQDRLVEKHFLQGLGLHVAPFAPIDSPADIQRAQAVMGPDCILKTRRLGYDGKGQARLACDSDHIQAWTTIGRQPAVLEAQISFVAEISVICVRAVDGTQVTYDVPLNLHKNGILDTSAVGQFAGFKVPPSLAHAAQDATRQIAGALDHVGVLTAEFFITQSHDLLVNEIAPRVHNSGHWTMDACLHSQFDNHVRAVAGWPLGDPHRHSDGLMHNLIGQDVNNHWGLLQKGNAKLHLYGKQDAREGRKMGHITRLAPRTGDD